MHARRPHDCLPLSIARSASLAPALRRFWGSRLGLLAVLLSKSASFAAGPEIAIEQSPEAALVPVAAQSGAQAVATGGHHSAALQSDGTVVAWGSDAYGQATVPAGLSGVRAIAAGDAHTVALKSDGSVIVWGWNIHGQTLVPEEALSGVTAIAAGDFHTLALKSDGTVVAWGRSFDGQTRVPGGLSGVQAIAASGYQSMALKSDGTVVVWGRNSGGPITLPGGWSAVAPPDAELPQPVASDPDLSGGPKTTGIDVPAPDPAANHGTPATTVPETAIHFPSISGDYDGLIEADPAGTGAERHRQSGHLRVTLSKTGVFTGALTFGGTRVSPTRRTGVRRYTFMDRLDSAGNSIRILQHHPNQRRSLEGLASPPITLTLHFDAETQTLTGTAASTDGPAPFTSELTLAKRTAASSLARTYTVQIEPDDTPGAPDGSGAARVKIARSGSVIVTGRLADRTAFSQSTLLHPDQTFPLYVMLYPGDPATRGSLRGTLQLPGTTLPASTLDWFKPARPHDPLFPAGFTASPSALFESPVN